MWVARKILEKLNKLHESHKADRQMAGWLQEAVKYPQDLTESAWNNLDKETQGRIHIIAQVGEISTQLSEIQESLAIRPKLTLRDEFRRPAFADSPSGRLNPFNRRIPLIGRDEELADLREWLGNEENSVSFRCIIGPAGTGKTRLALEFCEEAVSAGWQAGFLEEDEQGAFRDRLAEAAWTPDEPTLIVVDYAASKADSLSRLLNSLAGREQAEALLVRVLLLERYGKERQGWWLNLLGGYSETRGPLIQAHFDPSNILFP